MKGKKDEKGKEEGVQEEGEVFLRWGVETKDNFLIFH